MEGPASIITLTGNYMQDVSERVPHITRVLVDHVIKSSGYNLR